MSAHPKTHQPYTQANKRFLFIERTNDPMSWKEHGPAAAMDASQTLVKKTETPNTPSLKRKKEQTIDEDPSHTSQQSETKSNKPSSIINQPTSKNGFKDEGIKWNGTLAGLRIAMACLLRQKIKTGDVKEAIGCVRLMEEDGQIESVWGCLFASAFEVCGTASPWSLMGLSRLYEEWNETLENTPQKRAALARAAWYATTSPKSCSVKMLSRVMVETASPQPIEPSTPHINRDTAAACLSPEDWNVNMGSSMAFRLELQSIKSRCKEKWLRKTLVCLVRGIIERDAWRVIKMTALLHACREIHLYWTAIMALAQYQRGFAWARRYVVSCYELAMRSSAWSPDPALGDASMRNAMISCATTLCGARFASRYVLANRTTEERLDMAEAEVAKRHFPDKTALAHFDHITKTTNGVHESLLHRCVRFVNRNNNNAFSPHHQKPKRPTHKNIADSLLIHDRIVNATQTTDDVPFMHSLENMYEAAFVQPFVKSMLAKGTQPLWSLEPVVERYIAQRLEYARSIAVGSFLPFPSSQTSPHHHENQDAPMGSPAFEPCDDPIARESGRQDDPDQSLGPCFMDIVESKQSDDHPPVSPVMMMKERKDETISRNGPFHSVLATGETNADDHDPNATKGVSSNTTDKKTKRPRKKPKRPLANDHKTVLASTTPLLSITTTTTPQRHSPNDVLEWVDRFKRALDPKGLKLHSSTSLVQKTNDAFHTTVPFETPNPIITRASLCSIVNDSMIENEALALAAPNVFSVIVFRWLLGLRISFELNDVMVEAQSPHRVFSFNETSSSPQTSFDFSNAFIGQDKPNQKPSDDVHEKIGELLMLHVRCKKENTAKRIERFIPILNGLPDRIKKVLYNAFVQSKNVSPCGDDGRSEIKRNEPLSKKPSLAAINQHSNPLVSVILNDLKRWQENAENPANASVVDWPCDQMLSPLALNLSSRFRLTNASDTNAVYNARALFLSRVALLLGE